MAVLQLTFLLSWRWTSGYIKLTVKIIQDSECPWGTAELLIQRDYPAGGWSWQGREESNQQKPDVQALMPALLVPGCCVFYDFMSLGGGVLKHVTGSGSFSFSPHEVLLDPHNPQPPKTTQEELVSLCVC